MGWLSDDLPGGEPGEREALASLADRLVKERPLPSASFRGDLRRHLVALQGRPVPRHLRRLVLAYATSGSLLLAAAGVSVLGVGPLAAVAVLPFGQPVA